MIDKILYTFLIAVYCLGMPFALVWSVRSGQKKVCPGVSVEHFPGVCPGVSVEHFPGVCPGVPEDDPLYTSWLRSVEFRYKIR